MRLWNRSGEQNSIAEALQLDLPPHAVISLTGAGGKTSLLLSLADELADSGRRTVLTTTTRMAHPFHADPVLFTDNPCSGAVHTYGDLPFMLIQHAPDAAGDKAYKVMYPDGHASSRNLSQVLGLIDKQLQRSSILLAASPDTSNPAKITSLPPAVFRHVLGSADAVLIEADGARRMPVKWPAPYEPVVPEETDVTICVAGLSALGRKASEVMYRAAYLPGSVLSAADGTCMKSGMQEKDEQSEAPLPELQPDGLSDLLINESLLFSILSSECGGLKGVRGAFRIFMNQADTPDLRGSAVRISRRLAECGIKNAYGSLR